VPRASGKPCAENFPKAKKPEAANLLVATKARQSHSPVLRPTTAPNCLTANDTQLRQPMMQLTCAEACKPRNASSLLELFIPPPVSDRHGTDVCTIVLVGFPKRRATRGGGVVMLLKKLANRHHYAATPRMSCKLQDEAIKSYHAPQLLGEAAKLLIYDKPALLCPALICVSLA